MVNIYDKSTKFIHNVIVEMKKVSWPTRRQLVSYTITVLITVVLVAIFFTLIDTGLSKLMRYIL